MKSPRAVVIGGGAAGFFAAIRCAEAAPGLQVLLLEKGPVFLTKVRISGGGRCNVTHACFDSREFSRRYPRGSQALIGPFHRFDARSTIDWFCKRGVQLKTEADGRMFPVSNTSETIINCLQQEAARVGVQTRHGCAVTRALRCSGAGFQLELSTGELLPCDFLILAIGGCRTPALGELAVSLGHTLEPPVPSLFTFCVETPWLRELAGVSVPDAEVSVPGTRLKERGPLLVAHWGLTGPGILRLSAWGARTLHDLHYRFPLRIRWLPELKPELLLALLLSRRNSDGARRVINSPVPPLSTRLWERLVAAAGIPAETRWSELSRPLYQQLVEQLMETELAVTGKSLNKDEFVTCGGVRLAEVNFKSMESRLCPGLHFAGECLDIDGITGGFNFQAAWTTGWIAGEAVAAAAAAASAD